MHAYSVADACADDCIQAVFIIMSQNTELQLIRDMMVHVATLNIFKRTLYECI